MDIDDIVGGLKIALSRGASLQDAMQSFYNAGYTKEEVEEAARRLRTVGFQPKTIVPEKSLIQEVGKNQIKPVPQQVKPIQVMQTTQPLPAPQIQERVQQVPTLKPAFKTQEQVKTQQPYPAQQQIPPQQQLPVPQKPLEIQEQPKPAESGAMTQEYYTPQQTYESNQPVQIVSSYEQEKKRKFDFVTILLITILVLLVGILISVFFFKNELLEFLNKFLD